MLKENLKGYTKFEIASAILYLIGVFIAAFFSLKIGIPIAAIGALMYLGKYAVEIWNDPPLHYPVKKKKSFYNESEHFVYWNLYGKKK